MGTWPHPCSHRGAVIQVEYRDDAVFVHARLGPDPINFRLMPTNVALRPGDPIWWNERAAWWRNPLKRCYVRLERKGPAWS